MGGAHAQRVQELGHTRWEQKTITPIPCQTFYATSIRNPLCDEMNDRHCSHELTEQSCPPLQGQRKRRKEGRDTGTRRSGSPVFWRRAARRESSITRTLNACNKLTSVAERGRDWTNTSGAQGANGTIEAGVGTKHRGKEKA